MSFTPPDFVYVHSHFFAPDISFSQSGAKGVNIIGQPRYMKPAQTASSRQYSVQIKPEVT